MCVIGLSYRNISIPKELIAELEQLGEELGLGYSSAAEAVKDAMRSRLEQLRAARINRRQIEKLEEPTVEEGSA